MRAEDTAPPNLLAPYHIRVTIWPDREPDIEYSDLAPWLVASGLTRAAELMYDMAEADLDVDDEDEDEGD